MVTVNAAHNLKVKRLKRAGKEVRWAWFHGVLPIAAQSSVRGCFLIGEEPANERDVSDMADVTLTEARRALAEARNLGMLYWDDDLGCERVHDFEAINPAPKRDTTAAERQKRRRDRIRAERDVTPASRRDNRDGHGNVTPAEVEVEVEGEVEDPPRPPQGGGKVVRFKRRPVPKSKLDLAVAILDDFNEQAGTSYGAFNGSGGPSPNLQRILGTVIDTLPDLTFDQAQRMTRHALADPWWDGPPQTGNVFGPGVAERNFQAVSVVPISQAERIRRMNEGLRGA